MSGAEGSTAEADASTSAAPFFAVANLTRRFGPLVALDDLSFEVRRGEIFGIAGPNGAGKSTLLNVCSGFLSPHSGAIVFDGERVEGLSPDRMCRRGLARTFQIPQVFGSMSIGANVAIGAEFSGRAHPLHGGGNAVEHALDITGLAGRHHLQAGTVDLLSRKMTMLAAALATQPKIVFMDEPLAGLNPDETQRLVGVIADLHGRTAITFIVVEHKIRALSRLADRLMVLHFGRCLRLDTPERVVRDREVIEVYLGSAFVA